ncbi:RNA polymerase sigma-I factor [Lysinibacillus endophyticus]|uniref:RNA polymerase sigma-I factor n=1 Tax=Ureibacillus endophyticus TaxID=1978490 RepID=UPI0031364C4F
MLLSIIHGIFNKKQNMNELAQLAKAGDKEVLHDLLFANTAFMKKTASFVCKRPIDEHDEEFSIAMNAFHDAIVTFEPSKGASFLTFAHLIIKRRLVDFIRQESARNEKLQYVDESSQTFLDHQSIHTYTETQQVEDRKEELVLYRQALANYNLSFKELTKCSPKHTDSRKTAFYIAQIISESDELYTYLIANKKLPIKEIESLVEVSRKTIERHRKYIIAVVLLLNSDFNFLKDYVKGEII